MRRFFALLLQMAVLTAGAASAAEPELQDFAFWRASAGWWVSDNPYLDRNLDYNIRLTATVPAFGGETQMTELRLLAADTALHATLDDATGLDSYRMFITLPTPGRRYILNLGMVSAVSGAGAANAAPDARLGDLHGLSIFRGRRIQPDEAEHWRGRHRATRRRRRTSGDSPARTGRSALALAGVKRSASAAGVRCLCAPAAFFQVVQTNVAATAA